MIYGTEPLLNRSRSSIALILLLGTIVACSGDSPSAAADAGPSTSADTRATGQALGAVEVLFSPGGGIARRLTQLIDGAKSRIRAALYFVSSAALIGRLGAAKSRGVDVAVYLDPDQLATSASRAGEFQRYGISVRYAPGAGAMHHKFLVVDGEVVATGSYNWTHAAEQTNDENLIVLKAAAVASLFERRFAEMWLR